MLIMISASSVSSGDAVLSIQKPANTPAAQKVWIKTQCDRLINNSGVPQLTKTAAQTHKANADTKPVIQMNNIYIEVKSLLEHNGYKVV